MNKYLAAIFNKRMLIVMLMGFSSGLPLVLIGQTLKAWMTLDGIDLATIGFFSLVSLPRSLKFLWAPFLDRYIPPLGRRRGWIVIAQILLACSLLALSFIKPNEQRVALAAIAFMVSFFSNTQDIALDAFRREYLRELEFAFGTSLFISAYRFAMWVAGGVALYLAATLSWSIMYQIMAALVGVGMIATLLAEEPKIDAPPPQSIREAFIEPLKEYFSRDGAIWIALFILLYKVGDAVASDMTMPFYLKMGYDLKTVAGVVKTAGLWATIGGGIVGGLVILRIGINYALFLFGILQAASTLGFAWLANAQHTILNLGIVVSVENVTAGMGTAAFVGFMGSVTNKRFSATQYALLSSLMAVPSTFISGPSGFLVERVGWTEFFTICSLAAIPGILLIPKIRKYALPVDASESPQLRGEAEADSQA